MATGKTTTDALTESIPDIKAEARSVNEYKGVMTQLVEVHRLADNTGLDWTELVYDKLTAQKITEQTINENYQQFSDSEWSITPSMSQIATVVSDRVMRRIDKKGIAQMGELAMDAVVRLKDQEGLSALATATTDMGSAGSTLTTSVINDSAVRVRSNATEPFDGPVYAVFHGYQLNDIWNEITAGIGTYVIPEGVTARVLKEGPDGVTVNKVQIYVDDNITIDGSDDAVGGVFAKRALVLVEGLTPKTEVVRRAEIGGGSNVVYITAEWAYGERLGANTTGVGMYAVTSDATAPGS
ncbi:MAG: hypothetical protein NUW01_14220 [Gemmatimonadaceae bacterium]|nr:hypothetical protein [Gemmatimonadaceae bacterium]